MPTKRWRILPITWFSCRVAVPASGSIVSLYVNVSSSYTVRARGQLFWKRGLLGSIHVLHQRAVRLVYFMPHVHWLPSCVSGMVSVLLLRTGNVFPNALRSKPKLK